MLQTEWPIAFLLGTATSILFLQQSENTCSINKFIKNVLLKLKLFVNVEWITFASVLRTAFYGSLPPAYVLCCHIARNFWQYLEILHNLSKSYFIFGTIKITKAALGLLQSKYYFIFTSFLFKKKTDKITVSVKPENAKQYRALESILDIENVISKLIISSKSLNLAT